MKGLRRYELHWHVGAPRDRVSHNGPPQYHMFGPPRGKVDVSMDLMSDKQVELSIQWTDENDHPVDPPIGASATWTTDDPTIINLTDNGDGTATAAATGTLGDATVSVSVESDGRTYDGDLAIVVVAGLAERVTVTASEPTEVTPDA